MSKLKQLSELLRDQTRWPKGFEWDYADTSSCALGLAYKSGMLNTSTLYDDDEGDAKALGLKWSVFEQIFFGQSLNTYPVESVYDITPEMVADKIDEALARTPVIVVYVKPAFLADIEAKVEAAEGAFSEVELAYIRMRAANFARLRQQVARRRQERCDARIPATAIAHVFGRLVDAA